MVGTAVYQVGSASIEPGEELQRVEARRADAHLPPAESGASSAADQPVDVEQRHDVQAAVLRRQRQRRANVPADAATLRWRAARSSAARSSPTCAAPARCRRARRRPARRHADSFAREAELPGQRGRLASRAAAPARRASAATSSAAAASLLQPRTSVLARRSVR